eukprot:5295430-Amphidinium_carterae.1
MVLHSSELINDVLYTCPECKAQNDTADGPPGDFAGALQETPSFAIGEMVMYWTVARAAISMHPGGMLRKKGHAASVKYNIVTTHTSWGKL